MRAMSISILAALAACGGGSSGVGAECRDTADCGGDLACAGVDDPLACGIAPREQCRDDTECAGSRCHAIIDPCSADTIGSECRPPCAGDAECGDGFRCDTGACAAVTCDAGFTCAGREVCDPARIAPAAPVFDRHHGCFAVTCSDDSACGARFCVNGTCQDDVGTCQELVAVP